MKISHPKFQPKAYQSGTTLIETMVALAILLIVAGGLLSVAGIAVTTTETQGHLAARTAEYAQDKMEQLLALRFGDVSSDTTAGFITNPNGCCGLTAGGSLSTTAPTAKYVDYLDASGSPVAAAANWEYVRVWQITDVSATLKQISVKAQVRVIPGGNGGRRPDATVVALKSSPF